MANERETTRSRTVAELTGMTEELGRAIAGLAAGEMAAGRLEAAQTILEGLVIANPCDPAPWALLSQLARRQGHHRPAWLCAEAAARLAPGDEQVRLVRAEALLALPDGRERARQELEALVAAAGSTGERARSLLQALGA